jgi:hypothetical protein
MTSTVDGRVRSFAISPAFANDQVLFVGSVGGVFKSSDGGATFAATGPEPSPLATGGELDPAPLLAISPDFSDDGTVFAGTDRGLFVSRDSGTTWTHVASGPVDATADIAAVAVSPDFATDGTVLASVRGDGLYRSDDAGRTFEPVAEQLAGGNLIITDYDNPTSSPIQFSPTYAADRTVFAYAGPSVLRSSDGGASWDILGLPSVEEVADSLGVEVDALSRASVDSSQTDGAGVEGGRRTLDTPVGVLSVRRLVAAVAAGLVVAAGAAWLGLGRSWRRRYRWAAMAGVFLVTATVAATVLAA